MSSGKSFALCANYLKRYFNVYAPDLKGFGQNTNMQYPYSLDDYCLEVIEYVKNNNLNKPCVVAHSFGGRIALKLMAKDSEIFCKVVLTGCAGLKPKTTFKKGVKKLAFRVLKRFVKREKLKRFYSKDYVNLSPVMKESFKKIVSEHLDGYLDKIKTKTLIINGDLDKETPIYMAKKLNKNIKDSRLIILKGAGHFCFIDKPNRFNLEVREFLLS